MKQVLILAPLLLAGCTMPGSAPPQSQAQAAYPGLGGSSYAATDGSWRMTVNTQEMRFVTAEGLVAADATPQPVETADGLTYQGRRMTLDIRRVRCRLPDSDQVYAERVTISFSGRRVEGCGTPGVDHYVADRDWDEQPYEENLPTTVYGSDYRGDMRGFAMPFRAVGTEPFWSLEMSDADMRFEEMNGTYASDALPAAQPLGSGVRYASSEIDVRIEPDACSDGMSDRVYPVTVRVRATGRDWIGCGAPESWFVDGWQEGPSPMADGAN